MLEQARQNSQHEVWFDSHSWMFDIKHSFFLVLKVHWGDSCTCSKLKLASTPPMNFLFVFLSTITCMRQDIYTSCTYKHEQFWLCVPRGYKLNIHLQFLVLLFEDIQKCFSGVCQGGDLQINIIIAQRLQSQHIRVLITPIIVLKGALKCYNGFINSYCWTVSIDCINNIVQHVLRQTQQAVYFICIK